MKRAIVGTSVLAGLVGLTVRRYRTDLAAARQRLEFPAEPPRTIETSAGALEYVDLGSGTPVLVIHGNLGGWDQSVDWVQRRLGPGFRSICPSRFGYPGSAMPAGATLDQQADVLVELLDELGLDQVAVVALSAGSLTAAHLGARHPDRVRVLVLESPVLPTAVPLRQPPAEVFRALAGSEPLGWLTASLPQLVALASGAPWHRLDPAQRSELRQIVQTTIPVRPRVNGVVFDNLVAYQEIVRDQVPFAQVQAPTLVVAAADSPLPTPEDAAAVVERLPNGELLQLPSGGHLLLGNVDELRSVLKSFLG